MTSGKSGSPSGIPKEILERLDELMTKPVPIELRPDGTLNIDETVSLSSYIDNLSILIPHPPDISKEKSEEVRAEVRNRFQVICVRQILGYTREFIDRKLEFGMPYSEIKQDLTTLGKDVEIILSACSRKFTVQQISEQQWGKYQLRYEEVTKLESVASLRREINVRRANWETSSEYLQASKEVRGRREEGFNSELDSVTDTLWKILHLGSNYLSGKERLDLKIKTSGKERKDRLAYVQEELLKLRLAYLDSWRSDPEKFRIPRVKS